MKKIPFLSFSLLLVTYSIFGWHLANAQVSLLLYLVVIFGIIFLDAILAFPVLNFKVLLPWFESDIYTFLSTIFTAFLFVFVITWIHISLHSLVLISAGILVKLDNQLYGLNRWQSFGILLMLSEGSLGLGIGLYKLLESTTTNFEGLTIIYDSFYSLLETFDQISI
ncbi:MAG: hypothetical protein AB4080_06860 [Trichodesmium sp.]